MVHCTDEKSDCQNDSNWQVALAGLFCVFRLNDSHHISEICPVMDYMSDDAMLMIYDNDRKAVYYGLGDSLLTKLPLCGQHAHGVYKFSTIKATPEKPNLWEDFLSHLTASQQRRLKNAQPETVSYFRQVTWEGLKPTKGIKAAAKDEWKKLKLDLLAYALPREKYVSKLPPRVNKLKSCGFCGDPVITGLALVHMEMMVAGTDDTAHQQLDVKSPFINEPRDLIKIDLNDDDAHRPELDKPCMIIYHKDDSYGIASHCGDVVVAAGVDPEFVKRFYMANETLSIKEFYAHLARRPTARVIPKDRFWQAQVPLGKPMETRGLA
eukprot:Protomagalhaensia_wolfi_Nauph_80__1698@NODE_2053_length_1230_cov_78_826196_g1605_i0_p1_GENE_NODE_2053_length_1230_cov_78_826196_g1605_i0NODE_2053_length_1230_cov_78_826196_g1605_i0_p1_ORF_typecomplete_len323_score38_75_NODE_2053_length_1230_cov_78_826196_g1605_i01241092